MDEILLSLLEEDERFGVITSSTSPLQEIAKLRGAIFGGSLKVGENGVTIATLEQANALMDKMQFGAADSVEITARENVDAVYQHDSAEATTKIAKRIMAGATDKSLIPAEPHPLVDKVLRPVIEDVRQNDGESFVAKLGLRKSDQQQSWTARTEGNSPDGGGIKR